MINKYLEDLKGHNELENEVLDYYIDNNYENVNELLRDMENLQKYGCVSGMINSLIYYDDTNNFYEKYKEEINDVLADVMDGTGLSMEELFGDKFDREDPLVINYNNKNLLAWFGFEKMSNRLYDEIYEKVKNNNFEFSY